MRTFNVFLCVLKMRKIHLSFNVQVDVLIETDRNESIEYVSGFLSFFLQPKK